MNLFWCMHWSTVNCELPDTYIGGLLGQIVVRWAMKMSHTLSFLCILCLAVRSPTLSSTALHPDCCDTWHTEICRMVCQGQPSHCIGKIAGTYSLRFGKYCSCNDPICSARGSERTRGRKPRKFPRTRPDQHINNIFKCYISWLVFNLNGAIWSCAHKVWRQPRTFTSRLDALTLTCASLLSRKHSERRAVMCRIFNHFRYHAHILCHPSHFAPRKIGQQPDI